MTIEEAVAHCYDVAKGKGNQCNDCKNEHLQLAKWLEENKELKRLLKLAVDVINSIECQSSDYCIYCVGSPNNCSDMDYFIWKHLAEAEKLLEENENEKNTTGNP